MIGYPSLAVTVNFREFVGEIRLKLSLEVLSWSIELFDRNLRSSYVYELSKR